MTNNKTILGSGLVKVKNWLLYWIIVGIGFVILVFLATTTWIGVDVKEHCMTAKSKYEGDCVEALIQVVDNESNSFRERNYAIWSLGQLGDNRALPILNKYYTGNIPEREPYNDGISQYELKKAIKLIESGINISAFVWRNKSIKY